MKASISGIAMNRVFILFFVILLTISLLITGCGSSQTAQVGNPIEFFEQARQEMGNSSSFRLTGKMLMNYDDSSGPQDFRINYDMLFEKQEDNFLVRMLIETPTQGSALQGGASAQRIEAYLTKDKMCLRYPETGTWYYKDFNLGFDIMAIDQGFSPQSILKMLDSAKTVEIVDETPSLTKYYLTLDFEKLMSQVDLDNYLEEMKKNGVMPFDAAQYREMLRNFTSQMQIYLSIDKRNGYPTEFDMVIDKNILEYIGPFLGNSSLPQDASMTMSMNLELSDYGKIFNLHLPEEALQARPMEELNNKSNTF